MRLSTVTIYGTGLIGGSLALSLKRAFPRLRIAGVDKPDVLERAKRLNVIDVVGPEPADLVILATPVGEILRTIDHQFDSRETLVTDVGSTKVAICHKAERLAVPFIGGHPMAGPPPFPPRTPEAPLLLKHRRISSARLSQHRTALLKPCTESQQLSERRRTLFRRRNTIVW